MIQYLEDLVKKRTHELAYAEMKVQSQKVEIQSLKSELKSIKIKLETLERMGKYAL